MLLYWRLLSTYLAPQRGWVMGLAVALLTQIGLRLLNPQILGFFIDMLTLGLTDDSAKEGSQQALVQAGILFLGLAFLIQALMVLTTYLSENVAWAATNQLRRDLVKHALNLDLSHHKQRTPGEWVERIDGDVTTLARFFSQFVIHLLGNGLLLIGILGVLWWQEWRAGLMLTLFALGSLGLLVRLRDLAVPAWKAYRQISGEFYGFIGETIAATEDLKANGATSYVMQRFHHFLQGWIPVWQRARLTSTVLWASSVGLFTLGNAVALGIGAYLWTEQSASMGSIYLIFHYTNLLAEPIERIREELEQFQQTEASISRIQELWQTRSCLDSEGSHVLPKGALSIHFQEVWFRYPDAESQEWALRGISFELKPGEVLGLLGRTGSGKSSLSRLLLRLYDPQQGSIRIGGIPLPDIALSTLPKQVGLVTQDVQLFQATIRHNLTFFDPGIPDETILATLERLGLMDWLQSQPAGLDSLLAADSGNLSAGQAQLLAFARVFLKDPGVVILDEASSRLDPLTEKRIEHALDQLLQNRTAIIIAHHLQTVERADRVLILEQGKVLEYGSRAQLGQESGSRYHRLLQLGQAGMRI